MIRGVERVAALDRLALHADVAWLEVHDRHVVLGDLLGEAGRDAVEGRLADRVGEPRPPRPVARRPLRGLDDAVARGDVHDDPAALLDHYGDDLLEQVERRERVHAQRKLEDLVGRDQERVLVAAAHPAGVVDQHVDAAELIERALHEGVHVALLEQVDAHGERAPAERLDLRDGLGEARAGDGTHVGVLDGLGHLLRLAGLQRTRGDDEVVAGLGEGDRAALADPAAGPGDDRDGCGILHGGLPGYSERIEGE